MGTKIVMGVEFITEECCNCGMSFAMTQDFQARRRRDHKLFYCPAGHGQHYTGQSEEQKLRNELTRVHRNYEAQAGRATLLERQRDDIRRAHQKMRERVRNGMCPCCNQTFQNLMNHMHAEHPDFGKEATFKVLRDAFGLTQSAVAAEIGISAGSVSNYEKGYHVGEYVANRVNAWVEKSTGEKIS